MENILDRIKKIATNEDITITALEKKIGASKGVLSRAITNRTDIQHKWVQAMVENYPHYSSDWLLTGEGEMLKNNIQKNPQKYKNNTAAPFSVPLISFEAIAGFSEDDNYGI